MEILLFFLLLLACFDISTTRRHTIYWNSFMTPRLLSENDYLLEVRIGEFMDILCPQTSLMSITNGPQDPQIFDIFNVTEKSYATCEVGEKRNFIFACDRPERENKLTIKFQVISPSPLGFRFQYCRDYFFIAAPRDRNEAGNGCRNNSSTRLHIRVACKNPRTTTTTTTSTTTTTRSVSPVLDQEVDLVENVVRPPIIHPRDPGRNRTGVDLDPEAVQQSSVKKPGGGNGSSPRSLSSSTLTLLSPLAVALLTRFLTKTPLT